MYNSIFGRALHVLSYLTMMWFPMFCHLNTATLCPIHLDCQMTFKDTINLTRDFIRQILCIIIVVVFAVIEFPRLKKKEIQLLQSFDWKRHFGTFNSEYCISSSCSISIGLILWQKRLMYNINHIIYTVAFDPEDLKSATR